MLHKGAAAIVSAAIIFMPAPGAATTCATVAACVLGNNTSSGVGVQGTSAGSVGVYGTSTSNHGTDGRSRASYGAYGLTYANGTSAGTSAAGVYGLDSGTGTLNSGVRGLSTNGTGVQGTSSRNVGVYGTSTTNHGTDGRSRSDFGAFGTTYAASSATVTKAGVYGLDSGSGIYNSGVLGVSNNGFGVLGEGSTGVEGVGGALGVFGEGTTFGGAFLNSDANNPALVTENLSGGPVFEADAVQTAGADPVIVASIDGAGNAIFAGTVTESGTPQVRTQTARGYVVASYGARSASPTIEDFGTAQLRNGAASVALDRTFASTIDTSSYMVFITPHGDSNGLYADPTPGGFTVRENRGGRSTLAFDYRVVAKPLDARAAHLPALTPLKKKTELRRTPLLRTPKLR